MVIVANDFTASKGSPLAVRRVCFSGVIIWMEHRPNT